MIFIEIWMAIMAVLATASIVGKAVFGKPKDHTESEMLGRVYGRKIKQEMDNEPRR